ncbi:PREDICTED: chondroadherin-like protein [Priapulus caudatus]|uniref:Chondroadherin-like protein n=1 Tax=Priapulus caudatus TaxID=37621 RepID=A0ABM1E215_PRICU|nr:PREDICTED: chondroadherin-like protein [Priapulus caudatus]
MLIKFHSTLILILLLAAREAACWKCPTQCDCGLTPDGRLRAMCTKGGMDRIPPDLDPQTRILVVSGPADRPNNIHGIPRGTFSGLQALDEVHITNSNIRGIDVDGFQGLYRCGTLNLTDNAITLITDDRLAGMPFLRRLVLRGNAVKEIASGTFGAFNKLQYLDMSSNVIDSWAPRLFANLTNLRVLILDDNPLGTFDKNVFIDTPTLQHLSAAGCAIRSVDDDSFSFIGRLLHLNLADNLIQRVQTRLLSGFLQLKTLNLDGNQIGVVEEGAFGGLYLEYLGLSRNKMSYVFDGTHQQQQQQQSPFKGLVAKRLSLASNELASVAAAMLVPLAPSLEYLDLSGNPLSLAQLPASIAGLNELRALNLTACGFTAFPPDALPRLPRLRQLTLDGNLLREFPAALLRERFSRRHDNAALDLRANRLESIDEEVVADALRGGATIALDGNPWRCSCELRPLHAWVRRAPTAGDCRVRPSAIACLRCASPPELRGKYVRALNDSVIAPCPPLPPAAEGLSGGGKAAIAIVIILLVLIIVAVALYLLWRRRLINYNTKEDEKENKTEVEKGFDNLTLVMEDELPEPPGGKQKQQADAAEETTPAAKSEANENESSKTKDDSADAVTDENNVKKPSDAEGSSV